jgi:hypothetical protein
MRGQIWIFFIVITVFIILIDLYTYRGISQLSQNLSARASAIIKYGFWFLSLVAVSILLFIFLNRESYSYEQFFRKITAFNGFFILIYVPKLLFIIFLLLKDLTDFAVYLLSSFQSDGSDKVSEGEKISRTDFLLKAGLILAAIPFISILKGILHGKYNFKVQRVKLKFDNLPASFDGMRLVQISDLHIGSFGKDTGELEEAVRIINDLNADYVVFTGDMVNNRALEMKPFVSTLQKISARSGKFAILGNHDYGEYYPWESENEHRENMQELFTYLEESGFRLLKNESVYLEKSGDKIALAGVENWGLPPFPQHGDLQKALENTKEAGFKILLSHDPSHWDAEVLSQPDVDLTLSGHTHGMQFAIQIPGWRWSPVKFKYPRWAGLYSEGKQKLYVNIGLGFIAFPGRVGTPPEITEFSFHPTKSS